MAVVNALYRLQQAVAKVLLSVLHRDARDGLISSFILWADGSGIRLVSSSCCRCSLLLSGGTAGPFGLFVLPYAMDPHHIFVLGSSGSHELLRPAPPAVGERLHRGHHLHHAPGRLFRVSIRPDVAPGGASLAADC